MRGANPPLHLFTDDSDNGLNSAKNGDLEHTLAKTLHLTCN
jgi:hypothetical protein